MLTFSIDIRLRVDISGELEVKRAMNPVVNELALTKDNAADVVVPNVLALIIVPVESC